MAQLTTPQVQEFTNDLDRIAVALGALRQAGKLGNGHTLTEDQKEEILICQIKLFRSSSKFLAKAILLEGELIKDQMDALRKASASIDRTLDRVKSVQRIVDFSAITISVATAVATGNILVVGSSLNNLLTEIAEINRQL
jgi:hypothetical protein